MRLDFVFWRDARFPQGFPEQTLGGTESAVWELAKRLSRGFDCGLFFLGKENSESDLNGIRVSSIAPHSALRSKWVAPDYFFLKAMGEIKKAREKGIVAAVSCIEPALFSSEQQRLVLALHSQLWKALPFPAIKRGLYLSRIKRFDRVVGVSDFAKNGFLRHFDFPAERAFTIYNGVDTELFRPNKKSRRKLRERLGLEKNDFVVLFAGRVSEQKGLGVLLDAFKGLGARLVVAGIPFHKEMDYFAETKKRVSAMENAVFLESVPIKQMPMLYAASDIAAVPSLCKDVSPLVCYEAQASGLPVVAFNSGGIPEIVQHGKTGIVCKSGNAAELAGAISFLAENNAARKRLGRNALRRARQLFDWGIIARQYCELFESIY